MANTRQRLLQRALEFQRELTEQKPGNLQADLELARANRRLGRLHELLGNWELATEKLATAHDLLQPWLDAGRRDVALLEEFAAVTRWWGSCLAKIDRREEAEQVFRDALATLENWIAASTDRSPDGDSMTIAHFHAELWRELGALLQVHDLNVIVCADHRPRDAAGNMDAVNFWYLPGIHAIIHSWRTD